MVRMKAKREREMTKKRVCSKKQREREIQQETVTWKNKRLLQFLTTSKCGWGRKRII